MLLRGSAEEGNRSLDDGEGLNGASHGAGGSPSEIPGAVGCRCSDCSATNILCACPALPLLPSLETGSNGTALCGKGFLNANMR